MLFFTAFAAVGLRGLVLRARAVAPIDGTGPECCTDAVLKIFFHTSGGSQIIGSHIENLPPRQPLAILYPANDLGASLASKVVGNVLWPRQAVLMPVDAATLPQTLQTLAGTQPGNAAAPTPSGIFFCRMGTPPGLPGMETLMPGLHLLPLSAK